MADGSAGTLTKTKLSAGNVRTSCFRLLQNRAMDLYLVSCRKNFDDSTAFAPHAVNDYTPIIRTSLTGENIPAHQFFHAMTGKRISINFHGYRSSITDVANAAGVLAESHLKAAAEAGLPEPYDVLVMYCWPGDWEKAIGYLLAEEHAKQSGPWVKWFLDILFANSNPAEVHLQAHSLGNKVMMEGLMLMAQDRTTPIGDTFQSIFLTAPAIPQNCFEVGKEYGNVLQKLTHYHTMPGTVGPSRVGVFWSHRDLIVKDLYRAVNWFVPGLGADGLPQPSNTSVPIENHDYTLICGEHSFYRYLPQYYKDIQGIK